MPNGSVTGCGSGWRQYSNAGAFTLIDLLAGVALLALIVMMIILPALAKAHSPHCRINCANNLKQVGLSFKQWALDNKDQFPMQVPVASGGTMEFVKEGHAWIHYLVMSNELNTPKVLFCPAERNPGRVCANSFDRHFQNQPGGIPFTDDLNLSYFVGVDAIDTKPRMWLTGDANLAKGSAALQTGLVSLYTNTPLTWHDKRHEGRGNLGFADGSVQQVTSAELVPLLISTGDLTNRLAMP